MRSSLLNQANRVEIGQLLTVEKQVAVSNIPRLFVGSVGARHPVVLAGCIRLFTAAGRETAVAEVVASVDLGVRYPDAIGKLQTATISRERFLESGIVLNWHDARSALSLVSALFHGLRKFAAESCVVEVARRDLFQKFVRFRRRRQLDRFSVRQINRRVVDVLDEGFSVPREL